MKSFEFGSGFGALGGFKGLGFKVLGGWDSVRGYLGLNSMLYKALKFRAPGKTMMKGLCCSGP